MRINYLLIISCFFISCNSFHSSESSSLLPVKEYGHWGYINEDGVKVIECKFSYAARFYEGLAAVKVDSLWGFIDQTGKMIIAPKFIIPDERFTDYHRFSDGLCPVQIRTYTGIQNVYIKRNSQIAFTSPYGYMGIGEFNAGRAKVSINDEVCFVDRTGKVAIKTGFPYGWKFSEGVGHVWSGDSTHYIDSTGNIIAAFAGMGHGDFTDGLALIRDEVDYYIDKTGKRKVVSSAKGYVHFDFSDGLARVYDQSTTASGFIDKNGVIVIPVKYDLANEFSDGLCAVVENGHWGFIDKQGKMIVLPRFEEVGNQGFRNGIAWVKENHQWGYINKKGEYVWREQFGVQYGKIDLTKWDLDTLEVSTPLTDHSFEAYDNFVRQGKFDSVNDLLLKLDSTDITVYMDRYFAYKLYLINGTTDTLNIPVQDGVLKVIQQAVNQNHQWQDIDNFINSFCGHSYRSYKIAPGSHQIFPAVFFKGPYKTKFRFKLNLGDKDVYSNTYTGFMNVSQFISPKDIDKTEISVLAN